MNGFGYPDVYMYLPGYVVLQFDLILEECRRRMAEKKKSHAIGTIVGGGIPSTDFIYGFVQRFRPSIFKADRSIIIKSRSKEFLFIYLRVAKSSMLRPSSRCTLPSIHPAVYTR